MMRKCCFCFDIRSGTIASGVFILVTRTFVLILFSVILGLRQSDSQSAVDKSFKYSRRYNTWEELWYYKISYSNTQLISSIIFCCLFLVFCTLLLIGVKKESKSLFWPWIILVALEILGGIGLIIMSFVVKSPIDALPTVLSVLVGITLQAYMLSCVITYYKLLAARDNPITTYTVIPIKNTTVIQPVGNTPSPFYSNSGLGYNAPPSQPPNYESKRSDSLYDNAATENPLPYEGKAPPYDYGRKQ